MKSKSTIFGALLLVCGIGGGLAYANIDSLESALARANGHSHSVQGAASPNRGSDHLGCHRHGAVTYHCH